MINLFCPVQVGGKSQRPAMSTNFASEAYTYSISAQNSVRAPPGFAIGF
jgi:hypothetical protein